MLKESRGCKEYSPLRTQRTQRKKTKNKILHRPELNKNGVNSEHGEHGDK